MDIPPRLVAANYLFLNNTRGWSLSTPFFMPGQPVTTIMYKPSPALAPVLYVPGKIYQAGVYLRNRAFDAGLIPARSLTRPTVSVGNLTLGGTGKTPFVIYLAGLIKEMGYEAAILTRGYGRRKSGETVIVPSGENGGLSASRLGDEPALMRRRMPDAWLGISSDRFFAARSIERHKEQFKQANRLVFILDDGFQRRGVRRDLDIVMIDQTQPPDAGRLFPLGALREPVAELRRAHVVVINGRGLSDVDTGTLNAGFDALTARLRKYAPQSEFFYCVQRIQAIVPFSFWLTCNFKNSAGGTRERSTNSKFLTEPVISPGKVPNRWFKAPTRWLDSETHHHLQASSGTAFLVAAIGNPGRFRQDIQDMGIEVRGCAFFRDHAGIGEKDWEICAAAARKAKAEAIVITEKDAVKVFSPPDFPLFVAVQNTALSETARFWKILSRIFHMENP